MSIIVKRIINRIDENKLLVEAQHDKELIKVFLSGTKSFAEAILNTEITFEMDYDEIVNWSIIGSYNEAESGLFEKNGNILIRGLIHNTEKTDSDIIIDIYVANSAEFICILSSEINNFIPKGKEGIELEMRGLCIYPNQY